MFLEIIFIFLVINDQVTSNDPTIVIYKDRKCRGKMYFYGHNTADRFGARLVLVKISAFFRNTSNKFYHIQNRRKVS